MSFQPPPLTRERLSILLRALARKGGEMKARDLTRLNGIEWWEIDQAEEQRFITTETRKQKTGRPSKWAILVTSSFRDIENTSLLQNVNRIHPTKLLPSRYSLGRRISRQEWDFAFWYVIGDFGPGAGIFGFKRRGWSAYMKAYPSCYSKAAARSSASRLLKRPTVKAAIAWEFARLDSLPNQNRFFPWTTTEVWDILHRLGSQRARWAPSMFRRKWLVADLLAKETPRIFE